MYKIFYFVSWLICLLPLSNAYSTPGAYERLFYYYAYLADVSINNGRASTIATGWRCGSNCDFNHFVHWINDFDSLNVIDGKHPPIPLVATDDKENKRPDPEATARKLVLMSESGTFKIGSETFTWKKVGLTGHFNTARIVQGNDNLDTLIAQVSKFLAGNRDRLSAEDLNALNTLSQRIHFHRVLASSEKQADQLEKAGKNVVYQEKHLHDLPGGRVTTYQLVDRQATEDANGGRTKFNHKDWYDHEFSDPGHVGRIESAKQARVDLGRCSL
jgi:hypothetical protein